MKGHLEELLIGGRPMTELEIKQKEEIERLNNITNELEKILEEERKKDRPRDDYNYGVGNTLDYIWYKLQEIKGE